jgi:asparagine synthase (glutamine-hydrolysing)
VVDGDGVAGVVYGTISNRPGDVSTDLVRRVLDDPEGTLPSLDGPFALAFLDRSSGRFVLATDKLGTRALYYTAAEPFVFASDIQSVLTAVDDPTVDEQAVADLLSMTHVWGSKTLVTDVRALRPASYVQYEDGEWSQRRYWSFSFGSRTDRRYVPDLAAAFGDAVSAVAETTPDTPGLWLSGGLDSRILAATLANGHHRFRAFTYDRPLEREFDPFRSSGELAARVADTLDAEHRIVDFDPATLLARVPELVEITGGQVGWNTVVNLSAVFEVDPEETPVMMEGPVPILCGEHVWASYLGGSSHPADALYDMHARQTEGQVKEVLAGDVEPKDTFIDEARAAPHSDRDARVLSATHMNYNSRKHFTNNKVARARLGTREPLAHGALLDLIGDLPAAYRTQTIPFTRGRIPHVPSKLKLRLLRELDGDLADVPYEGSQLPPSYPHALHGAGFVVKNAVQRTLSSSSIDNWYRERDDFRHYLDDLLASAASRELFDREGVERVRSLHLAGDADHIGFIAPITTVELFLQNVLGR